MSKLTNFELISVRDGSLDIGSFESMDDAITSIPDIHQGEFIVMDIETKECRYVRRMQSEVE
jgi:hypothetical protein